MGIVNWLMHHNMRGIIKSLVEWAVYSYEPLRFQFKDMPDREIFGKMLDNRVSFPGGESQRETVLDRYGSSINGLCYYLGLNSPEMKGMMVLRCLQFVEYVDIELHKRGFNKPSDDIKRSYFKTLGIPGYFVLLNPFDSKATERVILANERVQAAGRIIKERKSKSSLSEGEVTHVTIDVVDGNGQVVDTRQATRIKPATLDSPAIWKSRELPVTPLGNSRDETKKEATVIDKIIQFIKNL